MIHLLFDTPPLLASTFLVLALQGLAVLLAFALARRILRHASADLRYAVATGTLVVLVVSIPATLVLAAGALAPRLAGEIPASTLPAVFSRTSQGLVSLLPLIGTLWLAGFLVGASRLALGALSMRQLCRRSRHAPVDLQPSADLVKRARLSEAPLVLESAEVSGPFVTGFGRGCVVLPAGTFARLSPAERDAVMLHELTHLRRGDLAHNLAQRLITALLWFDPAIWLVGAEIERIREECCDDAVVRAVGRPVELARALVRLEELRSGPAPLALASGGGALSQRVRRLLSGLPLSRPNRVPGVAALSVVGLVAMSGVAAGSGWAASIASRAIPVVTIGAEDPAGRFTLEMAGGIVRGMSVAGAAVPRNRLSQTGRTVHLLDERGQPALEITISTPMGIRWTPRPPSSP